MVKEVSAALDSLAIPYTLEVFEGGHIDRTRQRVSLFLLPVAGRFFGRHARTSR